MALIFSLKKIIRLFITCYTVIAICNFPKESLYLNEGKKFYLCFTLFKQLTKVFSIHRLKFIGMTVAKFKVVLRKDKVSKHGEAPVCLRITKDRRCTYKTLFHLNPAY